MGFCGACGLREPLVVAPKPVVAGRAIWRGPGGGAPRELSTISTEDTPRIVLPYPEVNRVLGGGLVPGSLVLLAGDPGIGKSTLLLQLASGLAGQNRGGPVAYVTGEESSQQVRLRAERLGVAGNGVFLLGEMEIGQVVTHLEEMKSGVGIVDSIQTVYVEDVESAPGSIAQLRECTRLLLQWAKGHGVPLLLAGHVTKGGEVAGPRVLEHMVDVVLSLEGEPLSALRVLRAEKNRFGSTNEVAVLQMEGSGLVEVADPSRALLSHRSRGVAGTAVTSILEGTRPLLVEIQALTVRSQASLPRRVANGVDSNRLTMLAAVLGQRAGVSLTGQDVLVSVVGGLRVGEPAADLAVALAMASSARGIPIGSGLIALGEVGLTGELRSVPQLGRRLREAERLGFTDALVPEGYSTSETEGLVLEIHQIKTLAQALRFAVPRKPGPERLEAALILDSEAVLILEQALELEQSMLPDALEIGWDSSHVEGSLEKLHLMTTQGVLRSIRSDGYIPRFVLADRSMVLRVLAKSEAWDGGIHD